MDKALTVNARDFGKEVIGNPTLVFYPVQIIDTYLRRNVEGGGLSRPKLRFMKQYPLT